MKAMTRPTSLWRTRSRTATTELVGRLALALLTLWAVGCGDDEAATVAPAGVEAVYGDPALTALTPYPSNRYTTAADTRTGLRVRLPRTSPDLLFGPGLEETIVELEQMDGFSTSAGVVVTFDGPIEVAGLVPPADYVDEPSGDEPQPLDANAYTEAGAPLMLINVDPGSDEYGEPVGLIPRWWEQPADDYYPTAEYTLIAMPAVPLRPSTRYLFVVTDGLRARDGGAVRRSADMEALLSGEGEGAYAAEVDAALQVLAAQGVARGRVALASTFTTASVHDGLVALSELGRQAGPPALVEPWTLETPLGSDGRIRFRAGYEAEEYRLPAPDGRFVLDPQGVPQPQQTETLEVFMAVSDALTSEPRTVVIYGHGLAGDKDGCWGTAERLAPLNAAVFAIDSPHHGTRAAPGDSALDAVFKFFGVDDSDPQRPTFVIGRARDNFRQMASDQLRLVQLIGSLADLDILPEGAPDGVPDLDVSRIFYVGHSFGSVQGPAIFALAPEISHALWNVGGDGLMMLLRDSNTFSLIVSGLKPKDIPTPDGAVARFMTMAQAIVDPGDPINYARFAQLEPFPGAPGWTPREVLLQEVVGDTIVPNSTSRALARATGLELIDVLDPVSGLQAVSGPVTANLDSGVTGAMSQFDRMNGDELATHGELIFSEEGKAQYLEFFLSALSAEHATIPSPY